MGLGTRDRNLKPNFFDLGFSPPNQPTDTEIDEKTFFLRQTKRHFFFDEKTFWIRRKDLFFAASQEKTFFLRQDRIDIGRCSVRCSDRTASARPINLLLHFIPLVVMTRTVDVEWNSE